MSADMKPSNTQPNAFDVECKEHGYERHGLVYTHALNARNQHDREHHALPVAHVGALARLVADAWDEWTDLIADGLEDPDVAHKANPAQRRFLILREAWMTVLGLEDDTQALAEARRHAQDDTTATVAPF